MKKSLFLMSLISLFGASIFANIFCQIPSSLEKAFFIENQKQRLTKIKIAAHTQIIDCTEKMALLDKIEKLDCAFCEIDREMVECRDINQFFEQSVLKKNTLEFLKKSVDEVEAVAIVLINQSKKFFALNLNLNLETTAQNFQPEFKDSKFNQLADFNIVKDVAKIAGSAFIAKGAENICDSAFNKAGDASFSKSSTTPWMTKKEAERSWEYMRPEEKPTLEAWKSEAFYWLNLYNKSSVLRRQDIMLSKPKLIRENRELVEKHNGLNKRLELCNEIMQFKLEKQKICKAQNDLTDLKKMIAIGTEKAAKCAEIKLEISELRKKIAMT